MVATFLKLKLTLLKNGFKRSPWQLVGIIFGIVYAFGIVVLAIVGLIVMRDIDLDYKYWLTVILGSLLVLGWWLVPVFTSTMDQSLDPAKFTALPIKRSSLITGLTLAGLIGLPGLFTALVLLATWYTWSTSPLIFLVAVLASVLNLLLIQLGARVITTFSSLILGGRRSREIMVIIMLLLIMTLGPLLGIIMETVAEAAESIDLTALLNTIAGVLAWTPLGIAWAAPVSFAAGNVLLGVLQLLLAAGLVWGLAALWAALLEKGLTNPRAEKQETKNSQGVLARFERDAMSATSVKTLRYWFRDSRLAISNLASILIPVIIIVIYIFSNTSESMSGNMMPSEVVLAMGIFIGVLYGWGLHNMLAYDGSAFWQVLSTGVRGRDDRIGRMIVETGTGLILTVIVSIIGAVIVDRWDMAVIVVATGVGALLISSGISIYQSTVAIYPVPASNENPFNTQSGSMGLMLLAQMGSLLVVTLLLLPNLGLFLVALFVPETIGWVTFAAPLVTVVLGGILLWLGVRLGAQRIEQKGPEILAALRKFS